MERDRCTNIRIYIVGMCCMYIGTDIGSDTLSLSL